MEGPTPHHSLSDPHSGGCGGHCPIHAVLSRAVRSIDTRLRRRLTFALRVGIAAGLIFLLLRRVDWAQFQQIVTKHGVKLYLWLIPIAGLGWFIYIWRWRFLLLPLGVTPSLPELVGDSLIGVFYGLFVPTGLAGDAVRAARLGGRHHAMQRALVSVAIDRIVGLFSVLLLFATRAITSNPAGQEIRLSLTGWAIFAALIVAVALIAGGVRPLYRHLVGWARHKRFSILNRWPFTWLARQVGQLWELLPEYAGAKRYLALGIAASILYQLLVTLVYSIGGAMLGIHVRFADYVWIVALVSLAQAMPITIAGLGVREGVFAFLLGQYGVSTTTSVALSLVVFSVTLLFGIVGGILELFGASKSSQNR
jgi:uncharacterized protein (TIRG00374 family)